MTHKKSAQREPLNVGYYLGIDLSNNIKSRLRSDWLVFNTDNSIKTGYFKPKFGTSSNNIYSDVMQFS